MSDAQDSPRALALHDAFLRRVRWEEESRAFLGHLAAAARRGGVEIVDGAVVVRVPWDEIGHQPQCRMSLNTDRLESVIVTLRAVGPEPPAGP